MILIFLFFFCFHLLSFSLPNQIGSSFFLSFPFILFPLPSYLSLASFLRLSFISVFNCLIEQYRDDVRRHRSVWMSQRGKLKRGQWSVNGYCRLNVTNNDLKPMDPDRISKNMSKIQNICSDNQLTVTNTSYFFNVQENKKCT